MRPWLIRRRTAGKSEQDSFARPPQEGRAANPPMNILCIVIDALRWDRLSCYGYPRRTSPNLELMAAAGVRFTQCLSPHIPTHPAHTTLFSGEDVFAHQVIAQGGHRAPNADVRLIPRWLAERGYFTGAVDNIGLWIQPAFERYERYPRWNHDGSAPWRNAEEVLEYALPLLAEGAERQPFFLFLHFWDPHTPYLPPAPFDRLFYEGDEQDPANRSMAAVWESPWFHNYFREWMPGVTDIEFVKAQYDASIAYTDACLGRLFNRLSELGLWEETLIWLSGDHGEELDEHGMWFDHHGLYETNLHVPLLICGPGLTPGRTCDARVSLLDFAPTALAAAGQSAPDAPSPTPGQDLRPIAAGEAGDSWDRLYLTECTWMRKRGWRTPEWKLIEALEPDIYGKPPLELFHLPDDPQEQRNLAEERPAVVAELQAERDAHIAGRLAATGNADPIVEQADRLRIWQERFIAGRRG